MTRALSVRERWANLDARWCRRTGGYHRLPRATATPVGPLLVTLSEGTDEIVPAYSENEVRSLTSSRPAR